MFSNVRKSLFALSITFLLFGCNKQSSIIQNNYGGIMSEENPQETETTEPEAKPKKVAAVKGPVIMPHTARARAAVLAKLKNK